jgi:hypothetical protein
MGDVYEEIFRYRRAANDLAESVTNPCESRDARCGLPAGWIVPSGLANPVSNPESEG